MNIKPNALRCLKNIVFNVLETETVDEVYVRIIFLFGAECFIQDY